MLFSTSDRIRKVGLLLCAAVLVLPLLAACGAPPLGAETAAFNSNVAPGLANAHVQSDPGGSGTLQNAGRPLLPVIHCTDLMHPHFDPDDHFDLATLYAMPGIDLKAVVLDQGQLQVERPGTVPVLQMNRITGRKVPSAIGLAAKLRGPDDKALDQKPQFQRGVELILTTLRQSPVSVAITSVGSLRDVVAAFNREPELFRRKVDKLMVFIGEASDPMFTEYNVNLDPQAYVGLMRSGFSPHRLIPSASSACFPSCGICGAPPFSSRWLERTPGTERLVLSRWTLPSATMRSSITARVMHRKRLCVSQCRIRGITRHE